MDDGETERRFTEALQERVTRLRGKIPRRVIADRIGIPFARYQKYETREGSAFPPYLLPRLAKALGVSVEYLMTGHEAHRVIEDATGAALRFTGSGLGPAAVAELADAIAEALARQQAGPQRGGRPAKAPPRPKAAPKE